MAKTETTLQLEQAIYRETSKMGTFGCFEVTIGWFGNERVDYMTYNTKGEFRCYEIKVTKSDFRSKAHNTFVGHFNYYVLTPELYEIVQDEIPKGIGVYISSGYGASLVKRPKRQEPTVDIDTLKDSLIRSLCRGNDKLLQSLDSTIIERKNRYISQLERQLKSANRQRWDVLKRYHPDYAEEREGSA